MQTENSKKKKQNRLKVLELFVSNVDSMEPLKRLKTKWPRHERRKEETNTLVAVEKVSEKKRLAQQEKRVARRFAMVQG